MSRFILLCLLAFAPAIVFAELEPESGDGFSNSGLGSSGFSGEDASGIASGWDASGVEASGLDASGYSGEIEASGMSGWESGESSIEAENANNRDKRQAESSGTEESGVSGVETSGIDGESELGRRNFWRRIVVGHRRLRGFGCGAIEHQQHGHHLSHQRHGQEMLLFLKRDLANATCVKQSTCFADSECGEKGHCRGVFVGKCNCLPCRNLLKCNSDVECGGLRGACETKTGLCKCTQAYKAHGFPLLVDARRDFCNVQTCDASSDTCFGLPCRSGHCFCPAN